LQAGAQTTWRFDRKEARNLPLLIQFTVVRSSIKTFVINENIKNGAIYIMEKFPIVTGIAFLMISFLLLNYQLKKNESYKVIKNRTATSKSVEVQTWILITIFLIVGLIFIFKINNH
jgi:hypothetical protein